MGSSGNFIQTMMAGPWDPAGMAVTALVGGGKEALKGNWVKALGNVVDPMGVIVSSATNMWINPFGEFARRATENLGNVATGEERFFEHKNWYGGKSSWITEQMRGTTEGAYYKDWDAYNEQQRQRQAAAKQRLADENRLKSEKKRQGVGVAGYTSTLTDDEYSYAKGIL